MVNVPGRPFPSLSNICEANISKREAPESCFSRISREPLLKGKAQYS